MTERIPTTRRRLPRIVFGVVIDVLAQGCGSPQAPVTGAEPARAEANAPRLPPGAIQVGEDLYQVPVGEDEEGCTMYRLHSQSLLVAQVISYRSAAGGFTTDRRKADCTTSRPE
jgi:hypothetical protein